ncbi:hypothetical protein WN48_05863 [Eufriesea mexicana]|uniref:Uncharacterized protein n=1 Tax=Eufriesea mexicana TaxID=516756 RepID=A0A310S964_9HYME|nr:hypothetical protein WN48_05863 [Eufriesea mexicana]
MLPPTATCHTVDNGVVATPVVSRYAGAVAPASLIPSLWPFHPPRRSSLETTSSLGVATVSLGGVKAGAWGGRVSGGLALVPVVAAETEAATATDQREGLEKTSATRWRRRFERLLVLLSTLPVPGGGKLEDVHWPPEETSSA